MGLILAFFGLALLIFIHEFGHFLAARIFRIRVEEFMIGLPGPKIFKKKRGDTLYGITAIPFGGYVKLYGEYEDPEKPEQGSDPESFVSKPWYAQIAVIASGALFNVLIAIILFAAMFMYGIPGYPTTEIEKILPDSAAEKAGLKAGDRILSINDKPVKEWMDVVEIVSRNPEKEVFLTVMRGKRTIRISAVPEMKENKGFLGIQAKTTIRRFSPVSAFSESLRLTGSVTTTFIKLLITESRSGRLLKESSGPVGIVVETSRAVKVGFDFYLFLLGLISINLAIVNLIPIPPLDGGRIAIIAIEKLLRKKIPTPVLAIIQAFGIALFLYLMIYLILSDIQRYQLIRF
jgi:regulator of sigma E protease